MGPLHWTNDDQRSITKPTWLRVPSSFEPNWVDSSTPFHLRKYTEAISETYLSFLQFQTIENSKSRVTLNIDDKLGSIWIKGAVVCFKPLQNQLPYKHFAFFKMYKSLERVISAGCQNIDICQDNHV